MKKRIIKSFSLFIFFMLIGIITVSAVLTYGIDWSQNAGGTGADYYNATIGTKDEGYIVIGYSASLSTSPIWNNNGGNDAIILKYDKKGNIIWSQNVGGAGNDVYKAIAQTKDDGYVVVGNSSNVSAIPAWGNNGGVDAIIVKYNKNGTVEWAKNTGSSSGDYYYGVVQTKDEGYVAVGYSAGTSVTPAWNNNGANDALIVKYDKNGNIEWSKNAGSSGSDYYNYVTETSDGGIVAVGYSAGTSASPVWGNNGGNDAIIVKYDMDGNVEWSQNVGSTGLDIFNVVTKSDDGGFVVVGSSATASISPAWNNNGSNDAIIIKYDQDGNVEWSQNAGGAGVDYYYAITQTSDGGYMVGGCSNGASTLPAWGNNGAYDSIIVKYDQDGNILWSQNAGSTGNDYYYGITTNGKGDYAAVGFANGTSITPTWSNNGGFDGIIVKYLNPAENIENNINNPITGSINIFKNIFISIIAILGIIITIKKYREIQHN